MSSLEAAAPGVIWETDATGTEISGSFGPPLEVEALNASVLAVLLREREGILEIRRGSDLESEYLRLHPLPSGG